MQTWFIILSYLFNAMGNSLADLDLFTGDGAVSNDEMLPQYDDAGTEPPITSPAWSLDDASSPQEGSFLADTLDYTNTCDSDSTPPPVKLRAREPLCETGETGEADVTKKPRKKSAPIPSWFVGSPEITSFEELTCHARGYLYAVCDSGDPTDIDNMFINQFFSLSYCDLCMFGGEFLSYFRSVNAAELEALLRHGGHPTDILLQCKKLAASASLHGRFGVARNSRGLRQTLPGPIFAYDTFLASCGVIGPK